MSRLLKYICKTIKTQKMNILFSKKRILLSLSCFFVMALIILSCKKKKNPIPEAYVDEVIYNVEADPLYNSLSNPNNAVVLKGGYNNNGIVVYRQKIERATDDFLAFDATCPHEVDTCSMTWDSSDPWYLECECCGSRFNINGGYMEDGPAEAPLRQYKCYFHDGNLHIYN